jgi:hypothetical protein
MFPTSVSMLVMSILSDVQEELSFNLLRANTHINFAKYLVSKYKNTEQEVNPEAEWTAFAERFPQMIKGW